MLGLAPTWASSHNIQPEPCPQGVPQWGKRALGVTIPTLFGLFQEEKCHPQLTTQRPGVKVSALPRTSGNQPCWEQPFRTHRPKAVSSLFRQLPVLGSGLGVGGGPSDWNSTHIGENGSFKGSSSAPTQPCCSPDCLPHPQFLQPACPVATRACICQPHREAR